MRITVKMPEDAPPLRIEAVTGTPRRDIQVEVDSAQITQYGYGIQAYLCGAVVKADGTPGKNRRDVRVDLGDVPDVLLEAVLDAGQAEVDALAAQFEELRSEILNARMERDAK